MKMGNILGSSKYEKLIIYYFSGTGNAKNASSWIAQVAEKMGITSQLINMDRFEEIELPDSSVKTLIGFCSPTHGFNLSPIALNFIRNFPRLKRTDVFLLNTRGGLKLGRFFLPGLSGMAQMLPAILLLMKGFRIKGMQPLDLPSNWLFLHPGLKPKVVDSIYKRCHPIVTTFASQILGGKRKYKALYSLPLDIAIVPASIAYYLMGRFFLAKTLIATNDCTYCKKCIKHCPVKAIITVNHRPFWTYKCESCMRCVNACPQRAIEITHGFSLLLILISSFLISPFLMILLRYFGMWDVFNQSVIGRDFWLLIKSVIFIFFVFISYRILYYLMKFTVVEQFIGHFTLSRFTFWRRYKAPKF